MDYAYAYNTYKNNEVTTAPRKKLLIMLYEGAIRNLKLAEISMESNEIEIVNNCLVKAQDIILELMTTLNFEVGGNIARNLYSLYDYMFFKLVNANVKKDLQSIKEVKNLMEELRDTWKQI